MIRAILLASLIAVAGCSVEVNSGKPTTPPSDLSYHYHEIGTFLSDANQITIHLWTFHRPDNDACVREATRRYFVDLDTIDIKEMKSEYEADIPRELAEQCGRVFTENVQIQEMGDQ